MQIADSAGSMSGMAKAAAAGHFAVDPATGRDLMLSLSQMLDKVDVVLRKARALDRKTPLGELPEAVAVSELNRQVAVGDGQSLVPVLEQFRSSLHQAHEAVRLGMANYEEVDTQMAENYQRGLAERKDLEREWPRSVGGTVRK